MPSNKDALWGKIEQNRKRGPQIAAEI